jgi:hypothetical protein
MDVEDGVTDVLDKLREYGSGTVIDVELSDGKDTPLADKDFQARYIRNIPIVKIKRKSRKIIQKIKCFFGKHKLIWSDNLEEQYCIYCGKSAWDIG